MTKLTEAQLLKRKEQRRQREAAFPKCGCGAVLSLERQEEGLTKCSGCLPYANIVARDELAELRSDAASITTLEEAREIMVRIIGWLPR